MAKRCSLNHPEIVCTPAVAPPFLLKVQDICNPRERGNEIGGPLEHNNSPAQYLNPKPETPGFQLLLVTPQRDSSIEDNPEGFIGCIGVMWVSCRVLVYREYMSIYRGLRILASRI